MNKSLLLASLLAACAQPTSDNDVTGGGGKADSISSFTPKFCGINTLESAGPVFVAEVCFGAANASSSSEGFAAVRVSYTDDKSELYEVDDFETVDRDTKTVYVYRNDGDMHELTLQVQATNPDVPVAISGAVDRGLSFSAPLAAHTAIPKVTCFMNRRAIVTGTEQRVQATIDMAGTLDYDNSASIVAYDGEYAFDITRSDAHTTDLIDVLIKEYRHVEDEIDSMTCSTEGVARGTSFCKKAITIDANLGIDAETQNMVHAFNFWCRLN